MHAEQTFGRLPSFPLAVNELVDSSASYKLQIFNLAHAVFCSVSSIKHFQPITREFGTIKAILAFPLRTDSNFAENAGFRLVFFGFFASLASVFLPQMCYTNTAVHSARSD